MTCPFPIASELVQENCICQTCLCCSGDLRKNCYTTPGKYAKIEPVLCIQIIFGNVMGAVTSSVPPLSQFLCKPCRTFALGLSSVFRVPFRFTAHMGPLIFVLMVCSQVSVLSKYANGRQPVAVQQQIKANNPSVNGNSQQ